MKRDKKKNFLRVIILIILYIVYVVFLFWFHPFVASAAEGDSETVTEKAPGGKGNNVSIYCTYENKYLDSKEVKSRTLVANKDTEILGFLWSFESDDGVMFRQDLYLATLKDGEIKYGGSPAGLLSDFVGVTMKYKKGTLESSSAYTEKDILEEDACYYYLPDGNKSYTCTVTGMKIFKDRDALAAYVENGSLDGMIKEELDSSWYLKDIRCEVTADDSPSGSGGEEATYIKFFWLTDNLEDGDLIEVKTRNYVKKIGGDKISGFHDYITWHDNISAFDNLFNFTDKNGETSERASWTVGQKDAVKAWFALLENKPLIFKTYETDIYYFRPVRNGTFGKWCKVTMNRFGDSGSPYIEDVEIGDMDDDGEWERDDGLTDENGGNHGSDQGGNITTPDPDNPFEGTNIAGIFSYLFDFFKSIPSLLGDLPALVNSIIGFLPLPVIGFIAAGVLIAIALRIVGR